MAAIFSSVYRGRELILKKVKLTMTFSGRWRGLMFYRNMPEIDGLVLSGCNAVHTFWMRFPLDLLFLDRDGKVILTTMDIIPNRVLQPVKGAFFVLEAPVGTIVEHSLKTGDRLWW